MTLLTCYACNFVYANKLASHQLFIRQQNARTKTLKKLAFSKHLSNKYKWLIKPIFKKHLLL